MAAGISLDTGRGCATPQALSFVGDAHYTTLPVFPWRRPNRGLELRHPCASAVEWQRARQGAPAAGKPVRCDGRNKENDSDPT
ncbi:hypothetical protein PCLA_07f0010 [Pseudomonas citronellolis]|nr:hypothetical protein PCLA_07f0010 [Pseudomonas citronellolis]